MLEKTQTGGVDIFGRECHCAVFANAIDPSFFRFVTLFWPKQVKAAKLEEIHAKMVMKEGTPRTTSDAKQRPRPSTSSKPIANGVHPSAPASSSRLNGKSHR